MALNRGAARQPFTGLTEELIIAFDIGTTYSGVSFCVLRPGQVPNPVVVTSFPGQGHNAGAAKIPTIMYYNMGGDVRYAGAEADVEGIQDLARQEQLQKVEWFKLRMCPKRTSPEVRRAGQKALPEHSSIISVFGDWIRYLLRCTEAFFTDHIMQGRQTWERLIPTAHFVLSHPNNWDGVQQSKLRKAAVLGGLVPDQIEQRSRIHFVTEGEASMHFCLVKQVVDEIEAAPGSRAFIIADLGGGTLDFSTYMITSHRGSPVTISEVVEAKCELQGSALVTARAEAAFIVDLQHSNYGHEEMLERIMEVFDKTTKRRFESAADESSLVRFGTPADRDREHNIVNGNLMVPGWQMAQFFEPSVDTVVKTIRDIRRASKVPIRSVYLVGGFCASPYLVAELRTRMQGDNVSVRLPDNQTAKAVAEGAIAFYIDHYVKSRISKVTYGTSGFPVYDSKNSEHRKRSKEAQTWANGLKYLPNGFFPVLKRGTVVDEARVYEREFTDPTNDRQGFQTLTMPVMVYTGPGEPPEWVDKVADPRQMKTLFNVRGRYTGPKAQQRKPDGQIYYTVTYKIIIMFGLTEVKARIGWIENGQEVLTDAEVIYEELLEEDAPEEEEAPVDEFMRPEPNIGNGYYYAPQYENHGQRREGSTRAPRPADLPPPPNTPNGTESRGKISKLLKFWKK